MPRGKFITFEGGEGAGKSTQVSLLQKRLQALGLGVVVSREPGGSAGAEAIRHVLLSGAAKPLGPHAEAILFAAARADHLRQTIGPALESGQWVISDRFADSTRIYQGVLGNVDPRLISRLEKLTVGELGPDLTVILDIAPEIGLKRANDRRGNAPIDRFEGEAFDFHKKLREAYRRTCRARARALRRRQRRGRSRNGFGIHLVRRHGAPATGRSAARDPGRCLVSASETAEAPHPRETTALYGQTAAEQAFLDAYRGRMPHAWLIGGPRGIGKATLAYRMARFVFAHPDPKTTKKATSLALPDDHPAVRRVAAQAHSDLLILERTEGDSGKLRTVIQVDDVRRTVGFFGSTAGEGGWRVCIVDSADELNAAGANALLKILEEPPAKALLIVVSHAPGRLLPTIRSRCRRLALRPLEPDDVARALAGALARDPGEPEIKAAAAASDGSVSRALDLAGGAALAVRERVNTMLDALPSVDPNALHALGDALGRSDETAFAAFVDAVRDWLSARVDRCARGACAARALRRRVGEAQCRGARCRDLSP